MHIAKFMTRTLTLLGAACLATVVSLARPVAQQSDATEPVTYPVVSEGISPTEVIAPVADDGHRGHAVLRKPPGAGPFPAVVIIHGGLAAQPPERVRQLALGVQPSRFLAAGYAVVVITYRSRDEDPQSTTSAADALAAVAYVRQFHMSTATASSSPVAAAEGTSLSKSPPPPMLPR